MKTVDFRSLSIAAVAVLTLAGSVAAQEKPSGLLNSLEVQQLVKRAEPGDDARLATHVTALGIVTPPKPRATRRWRRALLATQVAPLGQA